MDAFWRPFDFEFFVNGLIASVLAGALCGLVGTYIVLRGMSYIGHGLSHATYGGFFAAGLAGVNVVLGAGLWGFACALLISRVSRKRGIGSDAAIGVITTASFALGVALLKRYGSRGVDDPEALLFGQILGVSTADIIRLGVVMVAAAVLVFCCYRPLLFTTFDPEVAATSGVPVGRMDALLSLLLAATVLTTMHVLGVTLVAATVVIPPVVARMLTDSFGRMLLLSTALGAACGGVGMILSYHWDIPSGPMIVLVGAALFGAVYALSGLRALRPAVHL
jgi:manganese/iron transport system permease protein/iron/zinc/copper transport system permease protein